MSTVQKEKAMRYCIFLQIDSGEWDYLRGGRAEGQWANLDPIRLFDTIEEAQQVASKFNTATVTEYPYEQPKRF